MTEPLVVTEFGGIYKIHFRGNDAPSVSIPKDSNDGRQLEKLGLVGLPNFRLVQIVRELRAQRQKEDDNTQAPA